MSPMNNDEEDVPLWQVKQSGIHDRGVFACITIPQGADIIQYLGEKIDHDEADERGLAWEAQAREVGIGAVYLFTLNEDWVVDGNSEDNPARLINHSCNPNCEAIIYGDGDDSEIWLVSRKEIKKDTELTFDYGFDLENFKSHPCVCGSKKCLGYIVGEDYREELKQRLKKEKKKLIKTKSKPKSKKEKKSGRKDKKKRSKK